MECGDDSSTREKMSIEQRLFRLLLFTGLACFLVLEAVSFVSLYEVQEHTLKSSREMGDSAASFAEGVADEQARLRFTLLAEERAHHIDAEIARLQEDTELLANNMTQILKHKELYRPRRLPLGGEEPILSGQPYLFFFQVTRDSGQVSAVLPHAELASNAADILALWAGCYDKGHEMTCFFASELGYVISADIMPEGKEYVEFFDDWYASSFDTRQRPWYKEAKAAGKTVFTGVYTGVEGYRAIACVAPYYDEQGFAGIAGMSNNIHSLYKQIALKEMEGTSVNFVLNSRGEVVLSSETSGPLAVSDKAVDLRQSEERDLAEKAELMMEGGSDVTLVTIGGEEYYLAYAPVHSVGWSYGTLIDRETVVGPAREAKSYLQGQGEKLISSLKRIFWNTMLWTGLVLLGFLAVFYRASRRTADRFVDPIIALTAGVRDIAAGNLDKKVSLRTGDELEVLADSFNHMTEELKLYIKNLKETMAEKERIETELSVAARIQAGILPKDFPRQAGFELYAAMHPAKEVGGDFYDFAFLDDHRILVTIADVSDKGVPAALFMVRAKTVLSASILMTEKEGGTLADAVMIANDELCKNNEEELFVTVFTAVIDLAAGKVTYVNAGHNAPALVRPAKGEERGEAGCIFKGKNPMLAVMDGLPFSEETLQLEPGDTLFLYTDGVTEAMNREQEMFSQEKMLSTLASLAGRTAEEIVEGLLSAVRVHAAGGDTAQEASFASPQGTSFASPQGTSFASLASQSDDITVLCVRWQGK